MSERTKSILWVIVTGVLMLGFTGAVLSDYDDDDDDDHRGRRSSRDVAPVTNVLYAEECSACHMAYQPGLLPESAWETVMAPEGLIDHYGDDASLGEAARAEIEDYLTNHSADKAKRSRSRAFAKGSLSSAIKPGESLPRISATRYFLHEHDEIPERLVSGNPDVLSYSQCDACHRAADDGIYNEHQVIIPGAGPWDD